MVVDPYSCPNCESNDMDNIDHTYDDSEDAGIITIEKECNDCGCQLEVTYMLKDPLVVITSQHDNFILARELIQHGKLSCKEVQNLLSENHTESNCRCDGLETETMRQEGAGDMEICLICFGAKGCIY